MENLRAFLEQDLTVSDKDWSIIKQKTHSDSCAKGQILTATGTVENHLYFLLDGAVRLYYSAENKDITLNIGFPNAFISAYTSFLTQEKSNFTLETLTTCRYCYLTHSGLDYIYEHTQCGHELGRILTEQIFLYLSQRENSFLLKSPTERYLDLFHEQPKLIQEIPQKYLASYIGVTPQALSRIRAKLSESN